MRHLTVSALAVLLAMPVAHAAPAGHEDQAQQGLHIAAIVNDQAISSYDLDNRLKFIVATAHFSNTPDVIERIRPQIIRSLIDERLQLQEAAKNDIKISDAEVAQAIAGIEQERGMPAGTIDHILQESHVPKDTFTQQIRAQLAWHKLLLKKIKPNIRISDEDIKLGRLSASVRPAPPKPVDGKQEWQIAVIALPVDKPSRDTEMHRLADKLVKEIHGGASFEEVSRQFSSGAANAGGKLETFWVKPDQLDPAVANALSGATAGFVSAPVRTNEGYTIVKVYGARSGGGASPAAEETKDMEVTMKQILLKLKPDAQSKEANVLLQIAEEVARHPGSCEDKGVAGIEDLSDVDIQVDFRKALLSQLPPAIKIIAENLQVGDISTPFASDEGIRLFMLCDKKEPGKELDRDRIFALLMQEKMNLEAQKYMRNLRREAFIEVRP